MSRSVSMVLAKGLGDSAVYSRLLYGSGYWDFTAGAESATETDGCKVFASELATASPDTSWYISSLEVPDGGPFAVEIILAADGTKVGDDIILSSTETSGGTGPAWTQTGTNVPITATEMITIALRELNVLPSELEDLAPTLRKLNLIMRNFLFWHKAEVPFIDMSLEDMSPFDSRYNELFIVKLAIAESVPFKASADTKQMLVARETTLTAEIHYHEALGRTGKTSVPLSRGM